MAAALCVVARSTHLRGVERFFRVRQWLFLLRGVVYEVRCDGKVADSVLS